MEQDLENRFQELHKILIHNQYLISTDVRLCVNNILSLSNQSVSALETAFLSLANQSQIPETTVYFYSVAFVVNKSQEIFSVMLHYCLNNRSLFSKETLYYLFNQYISILFLNPKLNNVENKVCIQKLLDYIVSCYESTLGRSLVPIKESKRNQEVVIVFIEQFLNFQHAPSIAAAERCKILIERMKKKVILVNTGEFMSPVGLIPFAESRHGSYNTALTDLDSIEWKSCKIPYFQCGNNMPNLESLQTLLEMIYELRPAYILSIGMGKIVAALASRLVPTLSINMVHDLAITCVKYQTIGRSLNKEDYSFLYETGKNEQDVIIGTFGFSIKEQEVQRTRESVNLPSETWLAAVAGVRLAEELTCDFWNMAECVASLGVEIVLIGSYDISNLESVYRIHPLLQGKVHIMGFVEDILSYLDLCDLYINPIRRGGGTSCVGAMSLGIPVITTAYGDVANNAGPAFQTASYDTMPILVSKYLNDFEFYKSQSRKAKDRANILLNAQESFVQIIHDFLERV